MQSAKHASSRLLLRLNDESLVDVRDDTSTGDRSLDQCVELFVASDRKLQVSGSDALHLEILTGIASKLQHFSGQVLEDRRAIDCRCGTNSTVRTHSHFQESVDSADRELSSNRMVSLEGKIESMGSIDT